MSYSMRRSYQDGNNSYHFKREEGESLKKVRIDSDDDTSGPSQVCLHPNTFFAFQVFFFFFYLFFFLLLSYFSFISIK